jgi:hypothetical protein
LFEVIDSKEQEQAVARMSVIWARQGGMVMGTPLVKAQQDRSIRVNKLREVFMFRSRLRESEQRLVPSEAARHIPNANDRPNAPQ